MKRIVLIIYALTIGISGHAQHQTALGISIGSILMTGQIGIMGSYGFGQRWSASYSGEIAIRTPGREVNVEYEEHISEFSRSSEYETSLQNHHISACYWPDRVYKGLYMEIGFRCKDNMRGDCTLGAGYCIPIWKGLSVTFSYETDLIATFQSGASEGPGANIHINWIIKTR